MADTGNFIKAIVVKLHNATDESQLELRLNDIVYILEQDDSGWWGGHKEGNDFTGWFPGSCVRELEEEVQELISEPTSNTSESAAKPILSAVPEESEATLPMLINGCGGLDLQAHQALHCGNRLVASPTRRVSGQAAAVASNDSTKVPDANLEAAAASAALVSLQSEYATVFAIAEDRSREIHRLQGELAEASAIRQQNEKWRHQSQRFEEEKGELQRKVQELGMQLEARTSDARKAQAQEAGMRDELKRAQQDSHDSLTESAQLRKLLQDKETELNNMRKSSNDVAEKSSGFAGVALGGETIAAVGEAARPLFCAQPPQASACPGSASRPAPRPLRANSSTRPASCKQPGATSLGLQSPVVKCCSTGFLPPAPISTEQEEPPFTSIKDKIRLFEQVARSGTPRRMTVPAEGGHACISEPSSRGVALSQPRKWEKSPRMGDRTQELASRTYPGRDTLELEEPTTDDPVNFNMSPMARRESQ